MNKLTVLLDDQTTGFLFTDNDAELIGQEVEITYHDENGIEFQKTGVVVEILESLQ